MHVTSADVHNGDTVGKEVTLGVLAVTQFTRLVAISPQILPSCFVVVACGDNSGLLAAVMLGDGMKSNFIIFFSFSPACTLLLPTTIYK